MKYDELNKKCKRCIDETTEKYRVKYPDWPEYERQKLAFFKCRYSKKRRNRDMPCYQASDADATRDDNKCGYFTFYLFLFLLAAFLVWKLASMAAGQSSG